MGCFGHGVQARLHDVSAAFGTNAVSAVMQTLKGGLYLVQAGSFALAKAKV